MCQRPYSLRVCGTIATISTICLGAPASAIAIPAGHWKFTANGNVNVHYIGSNYEDEVTPAVTGGLACHGASGEDRTSTVSNGLLPAALAIGASITPKGTGIEARRSQAWPELWRKQPGSGDR